MNQQAIAKQVLEQQLLNVAAAVEEKIDTEMRELDELEDDDIERIRDVFKNCEVQIT